MWQTMPKKSEQMWIGILNPRDGSKKRRWFMISARLPSRRQSWGNNRNWAKKRSSWSDATQKPAIRFFARWMLTHLLRWSFCPIMSGWTETVIRNSWRKRRLAFTYHSGCGCLRCDDERSAGQYPQKQGRGDRRTAKYSGTQFDPDVVAAFKRVMVMESCDDPTTNSEYPKKPIFAQSMDTQK